MKKLQYAAVAASVIVMICSLTLGGIVADRGVKYYKLLTNAADSTMLYNNENQYIYYAGFIGRDCEATRDLFLRKLSLVDGFVTSFPFDTNSDIVKTLYAGVNGLEYDIVETDLNGVVNKEISVKNISGAEVGNDASSKVEIGSYIVSRYYAAKDALRLKNGSYMNFTKQYVKGDVVEIVVTDGLGLAVGDLCFLALRAMDDVLNPVHIQCKVVGIADKGIFLPYYPAYFSADNTTAFTINRALHRKEMIYLPDISGMYTYNFEYKDLNHDGKNVFCVAAYILNSTGSKEETKQRENHILSLMSEASAVRLDAGSNLGLFTSRYNFNSVIWHINSLNYDGSPYFGDFTAYINFSTSIIILCAAVFVASLVLLRFKAKAVVRKGLIIRCVSFTVSCFLVCLFPLSVSFRLLSDAVKYEIIKAKTSYGQSESESITAYLVFYGQDALKNREAFAREMENENLKANITCFIEQADISDIYTGIDELEYEIKDTEDVVGTERNIYVKNAEDINVYMDASVYTIYDVYVKSDYLKIIDGKYPDLSRKYKKGDTVEIAVSDEWGLNVGDICFLTLRALDENKMPVYIKCVVTAVVSGDIFMPYSEDYFSPYKAFSIDSVYSNLFERKKIYIPDLSWSYTYGCAYFQLQDFEINKSIRDRFQVAAVTFDDKNAAEITDTIDELCQRYDAKRADAMQGLLSTRYNYTSITEINEYSQYRPADGSMGAYQIYLSVAIAIILLTAALWLLVGLQIAKFTKCREKVVLKHTELDENYTPDMIKESR